MDGRKVPIIPDAELVDMSFGTGAVKITPAHDPNDYATGKRHNLQCINILDDDGRMNANGGQFAGQPRFTVSSLYLPITRCATQFFPWVVLDYLRADNALAVSTVRNAAHSLSQQTIDWRINMVLGTCRCKWCQQLYYLAFLSGGLSICSSRAFETALPII